MESRQFITTVNCSNKNLTSVPQPAIQANGDRYLFSGNEDLILSRESLKNMSKMQFLTFSENSDSFLLNPLAENMQLRQINFPQKFIEKISEDFFNISRAPLLEIRGLHLVEIPRALFYPTTNLRTLEVITIQTADLASDLFHSCKFLQKLKLVANNVTSLPSELLTSVRSLTELTLEINAVKYLPSTFLHQNTLMKDVVIIGHQLMLIDTLISGEVISLNMHLIGMKQVSHSILVQGVRYERVVIENIASLTCNSQLKDDAVLNLTMFNSSLSTLGGML